MVLLYQIPISIISAKLVHYMKNLPIIKTLVFMFITFSQIQATSTGDIPILSKDITSQIFQQNKIYTIYVQSKPNQQGQSGVFINIFKEFCNAYQAHCSILNNYSTQYEVMKSLIGYHKGDFFCIIDFARRKKYIIPAVDGMTAKDIIIFQAKFQQGQLQPFYASQQPQNQPYLPCRKIVGQDLQNFLELNSQLKVIFLYTTNQACGSCPQLLRNYADLAQSMFNQTIVNFGYFDVFQNDHPLIVDEILANFLIFRNGFLDEPISLSGIQFSRLEEVLRSLMNNDGNQYKDNQKREQNNLHKHHELLGQDNFKLDFDSQNNFQSEQYNKFDIQLNQL